MVGRDFVFEHHPPEPAADQTVLEVRDLGRTGVFEGINFTLARGEILGIAGLVGAGRTEVVRAIASRAREDFDIRGSMQANSAGLSGGNQQKVLLAKWLVRTPKVLILDEPTRGVDVGAKMAIYKIVRNLAASGVSVLVVSSEMEEVLGLSHRVLVISGGRQRDVLDRADASAEAVMALAVPLSSSTAAAAL
jgi:ribose transport system ATP-binding protein